MSTQVADNGYDAAGAAQTPPRPSRVEVDFAKIPQELKELEQWVVWRYEFVNDRWTKVPHQAEKPTIKASSTAPSTWALFDDVRAAYEGDETLDGVGLVLSDEDEYVGIDFDHKIDSDGVIDSQTSDAIEMFDSFTEITPSGEGVRIFVKGSLEGLAGRKNTNAQIELYDTGRFLTVTGNALRETNTIPERQRELEEFHASVWLPTGYEGGSSAEPLNVGDEEVLLSARRAKNAPKFERLWSGDDSDFGGDTSAADLSFCGFLRFHGADASQIDRIFRSSPRMRDKWNEKHYSDGRTYGQETVQKAMQGSVKKAPISIGTFTQTKLEQFDNLRIDRSRYDINDNGVFPVRARKVEGEWAQVTDYQTPIAGRPIWPAAVGRDVTREGQTHVKLAWKDPKGVTRSAWVSHAAMNERSTLMHLDGAPVSYGRFARLTDWLADAVGWVDEDERTVFTRPYWHAGEFIQPGHGKYEYIGPDMGAAGTVEGWAEGLKTLLTLGKAAYPALVAIGMSAISPAVKLLGKRRPILLYSYPSTSGKGAVINYATSIWEYHDARMSPAGSTWRGVQDKATQVPDYPVFIDEAQQLLKKNPQILEDLLYFFGNGKSRVLSSPDQTVRGGDVRNGVAFFAAEENVLEARQGGSQNRVIAITEAPLPPNSPALAAKLERVTRENYGVVGRELATLINRNTEGLINRVEDQATKERGRYPQLKGDDAINLVLMQHGLEYIREVTRIELPIREVLDWLAAQVSEQRISIIDRETACLKVLLQTVYSQQWAEKDNTGYTYGVNHLVIQGEYVAFKGEGASKNCQLEVNPNARIVKQILKDHDFYNPAPDWVRRGWLTSPSGKHVGWLKRHKGAHVGRVWRFTDAALEVAGVDFSEDENAEKGDYDEL